MIEKELKKLSDEGVLPKYKAFDDSSDSDDLLKWIIWLVHIFNDLSERS